MPRPRSFDEDAAIAAASRVFWAHGYEGTSTDDLCAATGLGRSSLYNTFVGKRSLYETALAHYMDERTAGLLAVLDSGGTARDRIAAVLSRAVDPDPDDPVGCFVVGASVELGDDEAVRAILARDRERRLDALRLTLEAGRRDGSITSTRPASELALFVTATVNGLRVAACGGVDRPAREAIARTALDAL